MKVYKYILIFIDTKDQICDIYNQLSFENIN